MADKFEDLRTFVTVVETGGIGSAAAALGIVKSAVSRRLSDLEDRLGVTLIERTTRTLDLTETGRLFLDRARALLAELDGLERIGKEVGTGPLTVSIDRELVAAVLPSIVALNAALPDLRVALVDGAADVAIAFVQSGAPPDPRSRVLATTPIVHCASPACVARRGTSAATDAFGAHEAISISGGRSARRSAAAGGWLEVSDITSAVAAATAGAGVAAVPLAAIAAAIAEGTLIRIAPEPMAEPRHVVATVGPEAPATAALLLDRIAADLRAVPV